VGHYNRMIQVGGQLVRKLVGVLGGGGGRAAVQLRGEGSVPAQGQRGDQGVEPGRGLGGAVHEHEVAAPVWKSGMGERFLVGVGVVVGPGLVRWWVFEVPAHGFGDSTGGVGRSPAEFGLSAGGGDEQVLGRGRGQRQLRGRA
jgi:hypothetical protein